MVLEIEYRPEVTKEVREIVREPEEDSKVVSSVDGKYYEVDKVITVVEEHYVVFTRDGAGKESRYYYIKQTEDGRWKVTKRKRNPKRGRSKVKKRGDLSTKRVREAMEKRHGIKLIN